MSNRARTRCYIVGAICRHSVSKYSVRLDSILKIYKRSLYSRTECGLRIRYEVSNVCIVRKICSLRDSDIDLIYSVCSVKVLVRWAKGKMLTNHLPNLSLTTPFPPWNEPDIYTGRRVTPARGSNFWGSISIFQILDMRKFTFPMVDVRVKLTTNNPCILPTSPSVKV